MKKAIVIGATSGIGKELSKILVENGYTVGVTGRRKEKLEALQRQRPNAYITSAFDCTHSNALEKLEALISQLKGLDLLVFSSGTGDLNEELHFEIEDRTNQLNVIAFTKIMGWAFSLFDKQKLGHMVAISSIGGLRGSGTAPAYNASKAYQINYLEGLRQKAKKAKANITVTDIRPGFVATDMAKGKGLFWVAPPEKAAQQIWKAIKNKKDSAYVTKRWRIFAILLKILPNWIYKRL